MTEPVTRLAAVAYLNTAPLIEGLGANRGVEVIRAVPSRIASYVESGEADLGLASVIDLARSSVPLAAVPRAGMIGCHGRTLTVRLFSRVPPVRITTLHADTDSHTSTALARVILDRCYGVRPAVAGFDARAHGGDWPDTVLLIGDKVVSASPPAARYEHEIDLGEAWHGLTGLPFVYALWACAAARGQDPAIHAAADLLDRQRRRNLARLDWVVAQNAPAKGWAGDLAREYVGRLLHYEVGPREREAVGVFLSMCAGLGLVGSASIAWADGPGA